MRRVGTAPFLILAAVLPAIAEEIPTRRAGLWEVRTIGLEVKTRRDHTTAVPPKPFRQCTDAATDLMLMLKIGFLSVCPTRDVKRTRDAVTIDSACTIDNESTATHTTITGSFGSAYTIMATRTMTGAAVPTGWAQMSEMKEARWLGPCTAGQKPGDVILSGETEMPGPSHDAPPR
jgi:hypothetical protein